MNEELQLPYLFEAFYRRERRSVPAARRFAAAALAEWGVRERAGDVLLCVSELATNALVHGVPPGRGFRLHLRRERDGGLLRVEVHDSGGGEVWAEAPGVDAESGRGLVLVAALSDTWGVGGRSPGKVVWCEFVE
ncbi:ATP-binding protein [Streptomyces sp. NPDC000229]|uniref:ATP-binding protein n=1 Tax=Streptomyces sp. NPDC000229 TaxID=3154247 RepID=UPI00332C3B4F